MKIEIYNPVGDILLSKLSLFIPNDTRSNWRELYEAIHALKLTHPEKTFSEAPYLYVDVERKIFGFIFIEMNSEKLYYVY